MTARNSIFTILTLAGLCGFMAFASLPRISQFDHLPGTWQSTSDSNDEISLRFYPDSLQLVLSASKTSSPYAHNRAFLFSLHNAAPGTNQIQGIYTMWGGTSCTLLLVSHSEIEIAFPTEGRRRYLKVEQPSPKH